MTKLKVGKHELEFETLPRGTAGVVRLKGGEEISFSHDAHGVVVTTSRGVFGFDLLSAPNDEGGLVYQVIQRDSSLEWSGVPVVRPGEDRASGAASGKKKGVRVRAQMPGKIVKVLSKSGDHVERNQPIVVMEAMKMENEIRASQSGLIAKLDIQVGQAVETGADLFVIEPGP